MRCPHQVGPFDARLEKIDSARIKFPFMVKAAPNARDKAGVKNPLVAARDNQRSIWMKLQDLSSEYALGKIFFMSGATEFECFLVFKSINRLSKVGSTYSFALSGRQKL